jgi:hypothetical protein
VNEAYQEINLCRKLYRDILYGFTLLNINNRKINIKHLTEKEFCQTNDLYLQEYVKAKKSGLLTEKDKIEILIKDGVWSKKQEDQISSLEREIGLKKITLNKLFIQSQIKRLKEEIKNLEKDLDKIVKEREEILGLTVENYAFKKSNQYVIYLSFYDENYNKYFKSEEDFNELDENDLIDLIYTYKEYMQMFEINNLKKIAVSPFFSNSFFLSEDNIFYFYGRPIVDLTKNQIDLFSLGRTYKGHIVKSGEMPPENIKNLSELVDWYENRPNLSNLKEKNKDKLGQSYIGASKEELMNITANSKEEVLDLSAEAQKMGGELSFDQILKIHGV